MERTTFQIRRVLIGVVVGLALVGFGCYGWVAYRTEQYHARAGALVERYHQAYVACVDAGGAAADCAARATQACTRDTFWVSVQLPLVPTTSRLDAVQRCAVVSRS